MHGYTFEKRPFESFINQRNRETATEDAIDLLEKMLRYDKNERIKVEDAMKHHYFDPIRDFIKE